MLQVLYKNLGEVPKATYYSEKLRLRPNYLIYTLGVELNDEQKKYLNSHEVPWAEYAQSSPLGVIVSFVKSVEGGIYMPHILENLGQTQMRLCLFLLDPHLIKDFEQLVSHERQGVLIRRRVLASQDFKDTINLESS